METHAMTNDEWKKIECQLHYAVGQKLDCTRINIIRSDHVDWWLAQDYDLDLDIVPAIKQFMIKFSGDRVVSWKLFDPYIKQHHRKRMFRKNRTSPYANSRGWDRPDPPDAPLEQRKAAVARWKRIKAEMENATD